MKTVNRFAKRVVCATTGMLLSASAMADTGFSTTSNPAWKTECGSCHVAYPPSMLPADSWRVLMLGLEQHFGVDASVDAKSAAEIGAFLRKNAAGKREALAKPILRVTETAWFRHEHDEINPALWKNPKVKTPANCAACHSGAEQGNFSEQGIRLPK